MTTEEQNALQLLQSPNRNNLELGWELLHRLDDLAALRERIIPQKEVLATLEEQFFGYNPPPLPEGKWLLFVHELSVHQRDVSFYCMGQLYILQTDFDVALTLRYTLNLTVLNLERIHPVGVWEPLLALSRLQQFYWSGSQLSTLPDALGNLTNLRELRLPDNNLSSLPDSLWTLTDLQVLELDRNRLTTLPSGLGQLVELVTLEVYENQLQALPDVFDQLPKLQILSINGNFLAELPPSLMECSQLTTLFAGQNYLTSLPNKLDQLQQLQFLHLAHNQLQALPTSMGRLSKLQQLYVQENPLPTLPDVLFALQNLRAVEADEHHQAFLQHWANQYNKEY